MGIKVRGRTFTPCISFPPCRTLRVVRAEEHREEGAAHDEEGAELRAPREALLQDEPSVSTKGRVKHALV